MLQDRELPLDVTLLLSHPHDLSVNEGSSTLLSTEVGNVRTSRAHHRRRKAASPVRRSEERRTVTTLFCDLVGFTALSERNDPEVVDAMLRRYYAAARRVVESYGGTVEKFIGDAVVAVFGVPALHEDDPERAVRAGLRLVDEVDALPGIGGQAARGARRRQHRRGAGPPRRRPGERRGLPHRRRRERGRPPAVGGAADGRRGRRGDARRHREGLRLRRLPPGDAQGQEPAAAGLDRHGPAGAHRRRAAQLRVELRRARGGARRAARSCSTRPPSGSQSALRPHRRRARHRQEPPAGGVRAPPRRRPTVVTWRQGRCLPFGSNVTFWALSEIVRGSAGILESDGVARAEARLETVLPEGPERDQTRARLRPLLGLEAEEASREENFAVWRAFLEGWPPTVPPCSSSRTCTGPTTRCWPSWTSSRRAPREVPLLVLATARPGGPRAHRRRRRLRDCRRARVPLGPLSGDETAQLA